MVRVRRPSRPALIMVVLSYPFLAPIPVSCFLEGAIPSRPVSASSQLRRHGVPRTTTAAASLSDGSATDVLAFSAPVASPRSRSVISVTRHPRLPVWPAWNGAAIFLLSKIFGVDAGDKLEDFFGGRVCPISFMPNGPSDGSWQPRPYKTDPFLLCVHHNHSFGIGDPGRFFQRAFILPEGFPAHPHRGFSTLTYCVRGGMVHRDSSGIKQAYGETRPEGDAQWLVAGGGTLHEEMWDVGGDGNVFSRQELYQIWINLPSRKKLGRSAASLLGGSTGADVPLVVGDGGRTHTKVLVGSHAGSAAGFDPPTDVCVMHVRLTGEGARWTHDMGDGHETAMIYTRRGAVTVGDDAVPSHSVAHLSTTGRTLEVRAAAEGGASEPVADFLVLTGAPLNEPVAASGTMVMNTQGELEEAFGDYQKGKMGVPWDHEVTDEEWRDHVKKNPNQYADVTGVGASAATTSIRQNEIRVKN